MSQSRNLRMVICYDGTNYAGFQRQRAGLITIQKTLEDTLAMITGEPVKINGAGRTDAGVHAQGQVINFHSQTKLGCEQLLKASNSLLPRDILVIAVSEAAPDFHARFSAIAKTYTYRVYNSPLRPIFERKYVYHYRHPLDPGLMQEACTTLIGRHDFQSFQAAGSSIKNTERTINSCQLNLVGPEVRLVINADGFLYHMVRNIMGTLLLVGNKRINPVDFREIIKGKDRNRAGATAPAAGLCLEEVIYPE